MFSTTPRLVHFLEWVNMDVIGFRVVLECDTTKTNMIFFIHCVTALFYMYFLGYMFLGQV